MKPDWPKMLADLEAVGISDYKIALALGLQLLQIQRIKQGTEPKYSTGELLIAFHDVMVTNVTISSPTEPPREV